MDLRWLMCTEEYILLLAPEPVADQPHRKALVLITCLIHSPGDSCHVGIKASLQKTYVPIATYIIGEGGTHYPKVP